MIGDLVRRGDDSSEEHCRARLVKVDQTRRTHNHQHIEYALTFEAYTEWRGTARTYTQNLTTSPLTFAAVNNGNRTVHDAVLTITANDDTVRTLGVSVATVSNILWDGLTAGSETPPAEPGRINPGEVLVMRMGDKSVAWTTPVRDGYYGFELGAGHTIDDWLHIPPGGATISLAFTKVSGATAATAHLEYWEGWK